MSRKKIRVGVIFGGKSGEHEVSLVSATSVIQNLDKSKYEIIPIGITKRGRWLSSGDSLKLLKSGKVQNQPERIIVPDPNQKSLVKIDDSSSKDKGVKKLDVVFPVLHGPYGEDGTIQGLLELADIPYIGAGVLSSAVGMDKVIHKRLFREVGLPVVKFLSYLRKDWPQKKNLIIQEIEKKIGYPCFTKPTNLGSSVGISKIHQKSELAKGLKEAFQYDRKIIVEEGIINAYEIEVSVLGNDDPIVSVPGEIIASSEFYDYEAKYVDRKSKTIIPAKLPQKITKEIQNIALKAFKTTDCSGMARIDFLVKKKNYKIYLSEINTIPGFTSISMYPKLWEASGLSYSQLLDRLIQLAIERQRDKKRSKTSYDLDSDWYQKE